MMSTFPHFPAPIPLQWQYAVDPANLVHSGELEDLDALLRMRLSLDDSDSNSLDASMIPMPSMPSLSSRFGNEWPSAPSVSCVDWYGEDDTADSDLMSEETISLLLQQFGRSDQSNERASSDRQGNKNEYADKYVLLVHGYVRDVECDTAHLVPDELYSLCCTFYNEPESEYVVLGFDIYRHFSSPDAAQDFQLTGEPKALFGGQALQKFIGENGEALSDGQSLAVCERMLQTHVIEIASFTTNFSSLFMSRPNRSIRSAFVASADYKYAFTRRFQQIYEINAFLSEGQHFFPPIFKN